MPLPLLRQILRVTHSNTSTHFPLIAAILNLRKKSKAAKSKTLSATSKIIFSITMRWKKMMFSTAVCGFGKDRSLLQISAMPARFLRATVHWSPIKTAFGVTFMLCLKRKIHMNRVFCVDRIVTLFLSVKSPKLFSRNSDKDSPSFIWGRNCHTMLGVAKL